MKLKYIWYTLLLTIYGSIAYALTIYEMSTGDIIRSEAFAYWFLSIIIITVVATPLITMWSYTLVPADKYKRFVEDELFEGDDQGIISDFCTVLSFIVSIITLAYLILESGSYSLNSGIYHFVVWLILPIISGINGINWSKENPNSSFQ